MQLGPINLTSIIEALCLAGLSFVLTPNCVSNNCMLYASVQTEFSNSSFKLLSAMLYIAIGEITMSLYIWYETEHVRQRQNYLSSVESLYKPVTEEVRTRNW